MSEASNFASLLYRVSDEQNGRNTVLELGGVPVLVVQNIDTAQHILRRNARNYEKSMVWFRQALGASRFTENGEAWNLRQALSQRYLSRFDRALAHEAAVRRGRSALRRLMRDSAAGVKVMDDAVLRALAAAIMLEVFFGRDLDETGVDLEDIARMLRFGSEYSFVPEKALIPFPKAMIRDFMEVRLEVLADLQSFRSGPAAAGTLLGDIREMDQSGPCGFRLEHEMTMFFAAASETTAATMGWVCFLLSRNSEIQATLRKALADFDPEMPCWERIEMIEPVRHFVLEVLRIFPSTPVIARRAIESEKLGDYQVAAGEQILISLVGIQHDRRNYPDPWKLDISRESGGGTNVGHSMSFSLGPRMCGGSRFAIVELISLVATFIKEAEFRPTSLDPPRFRFQTQLMHEGGQPVTVSPLH